MAFSGLFYLALVFAAQTHGMKSGALRIMIIGLPVIGAVLIGVSRLIDYRHHWEDVAVGSLLGMFMAYCSYRQYFPYPLGKDAERPKETGPLRYRDGSVDLENGDAAENESTEPQSTVTADSSAPFHTKSLENDI
jgi:diacylglycerol diphosphate phosphatase/phosphatidate phosphatase